MALELAALRCSSSAVLEALADGLEKLIVKTEPDADTLREGRRKQTLANNLYFSVCV
jgi:hypothetical protein